MSVVKINAIEVPEGKGEELEARFAARAGMVDQQPGFEEFMLLPLAEVAALVRETDEFKLNCNLVVIDFLIRHGWMEPQSSEYLALVLGLRQPLVKAFRGWIAARLAEANAED